MGRTDKDDLDYPEARDSRDTWDGVDRRRAVREPALKLDSWQAIQSFVTIILMLVAGIAWGLKLESRIDYVSRDVSIHIVEARKEIDELKAILGKGILPIAAIRLDKLEAEINECQQAINRANGGR